MLFNVASLLQEHTGASREYDLDDTVEIDGVAHRLTGHARFDRTPRGILVRAHVGGQVALQCSRCLKAMEAPIEVEIAEEFIPSIDIETGQRIETLAGEEEAFRISARHELDLREAVRQYWAMALPMAPLCREDCPGLCPACGREGGPGHACVDAPADERWAKLASLRDTDAV